MSVNVEPLKLMLFNVAPVKDILLNEYGVVGGKIDEKRRKNSKGNQRTTCCKPNGTCTKNGIQKKLVSGLPVHGGSWSILPFII